MSFQKMSQQNKGSGRSTLLVVPMKRKRGRPCKDEFTIPMEDIVVIPTSDHVMNVKQTSVKIDDWDDIKVGHVITGVPETTCDV